MRRFQIGAVVSGLALIAGALHGQATPDVAPLKNWTAPLYWQAPEVNNRQNVAVHNRLSANATPLPDGDNAMVFVAITPCRLVDTRASSGFPAGFGGPSLVAGFPARTFAIQSSTKCSVPTLARAYSFNVTVVPPGFLGFLTVYPTGQTLPNASTLNDPSGLILANATIVPAGTNGAVDIYANNATDVILDINGYYAPASDYNFNTSLGGQSFLSNTTGQANVAIGFATLNTNITGNDNVAVGALALQGNKGNYNTAVGGAALSSNSGDNNTAIGYHAGSGLLSGSNNILIGYDAGGLPFLGNTIAIGDGVNQNRAFIGGIRSVTTGNNNASMVVIDSSNQLGTISSSRRYKEDIHDMGIASSGLLRLRPVTFRYKKPYADGSKPIDYGLIAEEVDEVYPELVVRGADGQIETVQYQKLTPMLLNEVQKEHQHAQQQDETIQQQKEQLARQGETIREQVEKNRSLESRLAALEALLSSKVPTLASSGQ